MPKRGAWSHQELLLLKQLLEAGHSYRSAGDILDRGYARTRQQARARGWHSKATITSKPDAAPPCVDSFADRLLLNGDAGGGLVIVGDVHAPCTDWLMATRAALVGQRYLSAPRRLVVAGDLLNFDAFSRFDDLVARIAPDKEIEAARFAIELWLHTFDQVVLILGNHDYRWLHTMQGAYGAGTLIELFQALLGNPERVVVSLYPYLDIYFQGGAEWRVAHLMEYSQIPLSKARKAANLHKGKHVLLAHQHHYGLGLDESGRYVLADLPALVDDTKLAYVQLGAGTKPAMKRGFALLRAGALTLFSDNPALTDWGFWLSNE